jgi:hypothetical protein
MRGTSVRRRLKAVAQLLVVAGLAACQQDLPPASADAAADPGRQASPTGLSHGRGRGLEEEGALGRLAARNPEFGGWFFDRNGDLNVWVVDPENRGSGVRAAVAQAMADEPRDATEKQSYQIKIRPARYGFVQLSDWRDSIGTRFDAYRGMQWTDVDDVRNRVSVSVDSRRTRAKLRRDAEGMGIPSGALNVMVASADECTPEMIDCNYDRCAMNPYAPGCPGQDPCAMDPYASGCEDPCSADPYASGCEDPCSIDPSSSQCTSDPCVVNPSDPACSQANQTAPDTAVYAITPRNVPGTLSGRFAELQGGIQIAYEDVDRSEALSCTLGFIANSPTRGMVVVTNAHCSNDLGSTDGTVYGQPTTTNNQFGTDWFGQEVFDPALRYGWGCWLGCRNSDANFVSTSVSGGSFAATRNYAFGKVARPIGPVVSISDTTTRLNTSVPQLSIVAEARPSVVGSAVHKIGRTTGWTRGTLTYYCRKERGYTCQDGANYVFRQGDSGSPVFRFYKNGTIGLIGIHHSRVSNFNYNQSVYSPLVQMRKDLGPFQTYPGGPF